LSLSTALKDIDQVLSLCPEDSSAIHEKLTIQKLKYQYEKASHKMATVMLGTQAATVSPELHESISTMDDSLYQHFPPLNFDMVCSLSLPSHYLTIVCQPLEPNVLYPLQYD
jgi:hypothetical protein